MKTPLMRASAAFRSSKVLFQQLKVYLDLAASGIVARPYVTCAGRYVIITGRRVIQDPSLVP